MLRLPEYVFERIGTGPGFQVVVVRQMALLLQVNEGQGYFLEILDHVLIHIGKGRSADSFGSLFHPAVLARARKSGTVWNAPLGGDIVHEQMEESVVGKSSARAMTQFQDSSCISACSDSPLKLK